MQLPNNEPSSIADGDKSETVGEVKNCPKCGNADITLWKHGIQPVGTCDKCGFTFHIEGDEVTSGSSGGVVNAH